MHIPKNVKFNFQKQEDITSLEAPLEGVVLFDFSWLLNKSYYSFSNLCVEIDRNSEEAQEMYGYHSCKNISGNKLIIYTGDFYGSLKSILDFARNYPTYALILCLDSPNPEKKKILPSYKANRGDNSHVYEKIQEVVSTACLLPNMYIAYQEGKEADDLIFNLSQMFSRYFKVIIHANDKDLYQSVTNDNIVISNKRGNEIGREYVEFTFGVPPEKSPFLRSICSLDTSDNVRAYPRFPRELAINIVNRHDDPDDFLRSNYVAKTKARQRWVDLLHSKPETMLTLYQVHKIKRIPNLELYKIESSFRYLKKYHCVSLNAILIKILTDYSIPLNF